MLTLLLALQVAAASPTGLGGRWIVDLATDPAKPYTQPMELTLRPDGTVTGSFYNSEILAGRWKTDRGRTCASFRTTDGAGPYHTSVCLAAGKAVGQTWAEHRNFLFNWTASRP
ncbi:MAG TPA: hypothetical protein VF815_17350 [Myxococcaceae bacterium]|jgi:hypothetical protein